MSSLLFLLSPFQCLECSFILPEQGQSGCFAIMTTHSKAAYIQPLLAGGRDNKEAWKTWVIGAQPHQGASILKKFSRATAEVQDETWQMEMH